MNCGAVLLAVLVASLHLRSPALAQDERSQVPSALRNTYLELSAGVLAGDFGAGQFRAVPGYTFESADAELVAARLALGHEFGRYLSVQLSLMRPIEWIEYTYRGADLRLERSSVRMSVLGLTLRPRLPVTDRLAVYGEAGAGIVTRSGFTAPEGAPLVEDASDVALLVGGGVEYRLTDHWQMLASAVYSPENESSAQPATSFVTAGFSYKILAGSGGQPSRAADPKYIHPEQWVQIGYSSNVLGYGVNDTLADAYLFWAGDAEVRDGLTLQYQRNIYHGPRVFALDWGVSASYWRSDKSEQDFITLAVFPVFRFNLLHTRPLDAYVFYSVAGPAYISRVVIDGVDTGEHFTFQDTVGVGMFLGERRNVNVEMRIGHYSNGNIFPENPGVKVPLSLNLGYAF